MPQDCQNPDAASGLPPFTRARFAAGLTQRELADMVGITSSYLSLVECGHRKPTIATAARLAQALGAEIPVLFPDGLSRLHRLSRPRAAVPSPAEG